MQTPQQGSFNVIAAQVCRQLWCTHISAFLHLGWCERRQYLKYNPRQWSGLLHMLGQSPNVSKPPVVLLTVQWYRRQAGEHPSTQGNQVLGAKFSTAASWRYLSLHAWKIYHGIFCYQINNNLEVLAWSLSISGCIVPETWWKVACLPSSKNNSNERQSSDLSSTAPAVGSNNNNRCDPLPQRSTS